MAGASSAGTVTCASSLLKEVYNPKAFIPHAASLHQAFAHCAIFPTAASRRSLGRVSVPVWPGALSGRLPVVALVGRYPTNKLIGRGPILHRKTFPPPTMRQKVLSGIRPSFPGLSQSAGQITHVLLTRSPLESLRRALSVRLACVKHAASVRPEPGSNSPNKNNPTYKQAGRIRIRKIRSQTTDTTNWHPKNVAPPNGKIRDTTKKQQTKTTKHTIEFSNNTPARPRNQPSAIKPLQVVRTIRNPPQWISLWESAALPGLGPCRGDLE